MLYVHGCKHVCVCNAHPASNMSEGRHVPVLCAGVSMWAHSYRLVHALKREPSCLQVRADRVTFSKGSAASDRAGLRALAGRR